MAAASTLPGWPASGRGRLGPALAAGAAGMALNSALLALADAVHQPTGHGGLLKLLLLLSAGTRSVVPGPLFRTGFHIAIGLGMALIYAWLVEPRWPGRVCSKALGCAAGVWLLNAGVILPLTGAGFAGHDRLDLAGMLWFAFAHTMFFLTTAVVYARGPTWSASPRPAPETATAPRR